MYFNACHDMSLQFSNLSLFCGKNFEKSMNGAEFIILVESKVFNPIKTVPKYILIQRCSLQTILIHLIMMNNLIVCSASWLTAAETAFKLLRIVVTFFPATRISKNQLILWGVKHWTEFSSVGFYCINMAPGHYSMYKYMFMVWKGVLTKIYGFWVYTFQVNYRFVSFFHEFTTRNCLVSRWR